MTIIEAVNLIDSLKPNTYSQADKLKWLGIVEGLIYNERKNYEEYAEDEPFGGFDESTDITTELLFPAPYEDVYIAFLESKIDYFNGEYAKYNNSITRFNEIWSQGWNYLSKSLTHKTTPLNFF